MHSTAYVDLSNNSALVVRYSIANRRRVEQARIDDRRQVDAAFDAAVIRVDQLQAVVALLSLEELAEKFRGLSMPAQVSIFGLFEDALADVRAALTHVAARE